LAEVTFTPNPQPEPACYPSDINGLLALLTTGGGISGTIPDNAGGGIYVGSSPPSSSLTNKVWYKTDAAGRPLGVFMFYNGNWRKVYTGVTYGEIRMFWVYSGVWDGTGRGVIGGDADGWALCNGQNGTPNFTDYWPVCGIPSGGGYVTDTDGQGYVQNGGQRGPFTLSQYYLPSLFSLEMLTQVQAGSGPMCATNNDTGALWMPPVVDGSETTGQGHPLPKPLYVALGFAMFVGYA
jgi:hypothetical protein